MNSNLIIIPTSKMSREDWVARRMNGLGASETGTVLGLNKWKSALELWYDKLTPNPDDNIRSFFALNGLEQENTIAKYHKYWEGTAESVVRNMTSKKIIRTNRKINGTVHNPEYPWLFVSPDRIINKTKTRGEGVLELKTMNSFEARKWETTVPPNYLVQVHTQMIVCNVEYGELATLTDGMIDVIPFNRRPDLEHQIIERTKAFWDIVLLARKLLTQKYNAVMTHNMKAANEFQAQIEALEPAPDGSEAYEQFIKDKYKKSLAEVGLIKGNAEDLANARKLADLKAKMKLMEQDAQEMENRLKRRIADNRKIDLGANGYVSWDASTNGTRAFRLNIK